MIDNAKQAALPVTCDTGLHHLFFTDEHLAGYDASFHSAVPFRSEADRDALRVGLFNGVIDAICSDHAPHDVDASLAPFPSTQAGLSAYAFALPLILQLPELTGMSLTQILKTLSEIPDRILHGTSTSGLEVGKSANFLLLQTDVPSSHPTSVAGSMGINHPLFSHSPESLKLAPLKGQVCYAFCHDRVHAINALDTATH